MNQTLIAEGSGGTQPLHVELLSEDELLSVSGGIGPIAAGALLAAGGVTVFLFAVAAGVAVYYFTH